MSILSVYFLAFLFLSSLIYYIVPNRFKPFILLGANIYFYLQYGIQYSFFLFASILTTYSSALLIEKSQTETGKKLILISVLFLNIAFLFHVKFTPYLLEITQRYVSFDSTTILKTVIVPVGIAFYTLQLCGYLIDVYRKKYTAERNFIKYVTFSTFFPLMLQGPISRYDQLSDQLYDQSKRKDIYKNYTYGAQLMLWGFFKKLVIADRVALLVNEVFNNYASYSGITVVIAILFYTIQIYTDFSGCVDICRGAAQLFGIDVMQNFKQPYFSTSIQDFWRRWHISLSSWFRDYLYIPLGGNRKGTFRKYVNLIIVFFASGLWHGVGLHYIAWGLMQGLFQIIGALTLPFKKTICTKLKVSRTSNAFILTQWFFTFVLINLSWLMFRADGITIATQMLKSIFISSPISLVNLTYVDLLILGFSLLSVFIVSYYHEKGYCLRNELAKQLLPIRWLILLLMFSAIVIFGIYGPGYSDSAFLYMSF